MAKLTDDELASLVRREINQAQGYDADVLASKRELALVLYTGTTTSSYIPAAPAGRSNIVSSDVRDVHGSVLSQITNCFKTSSIEFEPESAEDEDQAQLETDVVKLKIDQNGGNKVFYEAIHDALLSGTGWVKVYIDETEELAREEYTDVTDPVTLDAIMQSEGDSWAEITDRSGGNISLTRHNVSRKLRIESIDPGQMLFSQAYGQYDFQELRFVAERKLYTVAELGEMGLSEDEAARIPDHKDDYWPAVLARENVTGIGSGTYHDTSDNEAGGKQQASRLKECFHCYMLVDIDDSGSYERRHILVGGNTGGPIIINEPVDYIPYTPGSALPMGRTGRRVRGLPSCCTRSRAARRRCSGITSTT